MCFEPKSEYGGLTMKVAKKNIPVYKVLSKNGAGCIFSLYINGEAEIWRRGYEYRETEFRSMIQYQKKRIYPEIGKHCFHSWKTKKGAKDFCDSSDKMVEMYIPKGALYLENNAQYVSNRIVYLKP